LAPPRSIIGRLTPRDLEFLAALDRAPHTALQLVRLSETFPSPFRSERLARRRLQQLARSGLVRCFPFVGLATAGGAPNGYLLTSLGYRVLYGPAALAPSKRYGTPPAVTRHRHTHALTEFLVQLYRSAHREGVQVSGFCRENSVRLTDGPDSTYPDCAFQLIRPGEKPFSYFVELDVGTERVRSPKEEDAWERKLRIYQAVQATTGVRFRVLVLTTSSDVRADHILRLGRERAENPRRGLVYAATLPGFLAESRCLTAAVFRDHLGRGVSVLPVPRGATTAANSILMSGPGPQGPIRLPWRLPGATDSDP
jgi:hypothetical protein